MGRDPPQSRRQELFEAGEKWVDSVRLKSPFKHAQIFMRP